MKSIKRKLIKPVGRELKEFGRDIRQTFSVSTEYPPNVKEILDKYGDEVIKGIVLKRTPVSSLIVGALDAFSLGKFGNRMEKDDLDNLFHLFMDIYTENNKVISLEKNERVNMIVNPSRRPNEEIKQVSNIPVGITIIQLMENGRNRMGSQFFRYDSEKNNCQTFLLNVLQANNIGDQSDYDFIKQKTEQLFKGLSFLKGLAHTVTDLGAVANKIFQGGTLQQSSPFQNPKLVETIRRLRGEGLKTPSQVQSIVFQKAEFSVKDAKRWLKEHNYKVSKVDKTDNTLRFRQEDPKLYSEFRVKNLPNGIMLVLGFK